MYLSFWFRSPKRRKSLETCRTVLCSKLYLICYWFLSYLKCIPGIQTLVVWDECTKFRVQIQYTLLIKLHWSSPHGYSNTKSMTQAMAPIMFTKYHMPKWTKIDLWSESEPVILQLLSTLRRWPSDQCIATVNNI